MAVNLRDCGNVGAIARTAVAFGFSALITVGTTPSLQRKESKKAALAGSDLPSSHYLTLAEVITAYPSYYVVALETNGQPLPTWKATTRPIMLVLGNERYGLSNTDQQLVHATVSIPHRTDKVASLNVSNAFAIAAYTIGMVH